MSEEKKCNICGYPDEVEFKEWDDETRKMTIGRHKVPCLGHQGVPAHLWNLHPDFDNFERFRVRHTEKTQKNKK